MDFSTQLKNAINKKLPFVAYKWPNEYNYTLLIQKSKDLNFAKDFGQAGFVFSPFNKTEKTIIIPFNQADLSVFSLPKINTKIEVKQLKKIRQKSSLNLEAYTSVITKAIQQIKDKDFNKVVLSRRIELKISSINSKDLFYNLMRKYPSAFTYLWYHPKVGTWAGATPEQLLDLNGELFSTMALAGTQIYKENSNLVWGNKEKEEQQWVIKFISDTLNKNRIPFTSSKPFSLRAGELAHICTKINGVLPKSIPLLKLINSLSPTPAVAGLPREKAIEFIIKNENYNREFYTGFLGILNQYNNSRLFVNLRCMQVNKDTIYVYVGGGITANSNPLSEWQETIAKSKTILRLLQY